MNDMECIEKGNVTCQHIKFQNTYDRLETKKYTELNTSYTRRNHVTSYLVDRALSTISNLH